MRNEGYTEIDMVNFKDVIKKNRFAYNIVSGVKAQRLEAKVRKEMRYYRQQADKLGLTYSEAKITQMLKERQSQRNLQPKAKGNLHIFATVRHANWEEHSLLPQLQKFGKVTWYDWGKRGFNHWADDWVPEGRRAMNQDLLRAVEQAHQEQTVDVFFGYVSNWNTMQETIAKIGEMGILTVNLCLDDKPSFWGIKEKGIWTGPAPLVKALDINLTSAEECCIKYLVEGGVPVFMPEGANPEFHKPYPVEKDIEVSFVGQRYGYRPILINFLRKRGIPIQAFGRGWESGELTSEEMVMLYSRSKINLGFGGILHSRKIVCLKGRDFEAPMSGGLYLTQYNHELEGCYEIGKEIVCYRNKEELVEKIRYLLDHPEEAEEIRQAGYKRALEDHTWEKRFEKIFRMAGVLLN